MTLGQSFAGAGSATVLIAVVVGLYINGSPGEQRALRIDQQRVRDLRLLAGSIDAYWNGNSALPESLEQLIDGQRLTNMPADPVTDGAYEYEPAGGNRYRLCTEFERPSPTPELSDFWEHEAGRQCFMITPRVNRPAISPGRNR